MPSCVAKQVGTKPVEIESSVPRAQAQFLGSSPHDDPDSPCTFYTDDPHSRCRTTSASTGCAGSRSASKTGGISPIVLNTANPITEQEPSPTPREAHLNLLRKNWHSSAWQGQRRIQEPDESEATRRTAALHARSRPDPHAGSCGAKKREPPSLRGRAAIMIRVQGGTHMTSLQGCEASIPKRRLTAFTGTPARGRARWCSTRDAGLKSTRRTERSGMQGLMPTLAQPRKSMCSTG